MYSQLWVKELQWPRSFLNWYCYSHRHQNMIYKRTISLTWASNKETFYLDIGPDIDICQLLRAYGVTEKAGWQQLECALPELTVFKCCRPHEQCSVTKLRSGSVKFVPMCLHCNCALKFLVQINWLCCFVYQRSCLLAQDLGKPRKRCVFLFHSATKNACTFFGELNKV